MILAVIPAQGTSTRLPGKNLLRIDDKSLIEHAVNYARSSKSIDKVYVSTDSDEIAAHAKKLGTGTIMRGSHLSGDAPLIDVYRHAYNQLMAVYGNIIYIVGIQPDHPDRSTILDKAIEYTIREKIDDLFTVDSKGVRNGALRILSDRALKADLSLYPSAIIDDCTNIHTMYDFQLAKKGMVGEAFVEVESVRIGPNEPVFVIAEAACNHMCDLNIALEMIDEAAKAGASAIKFQTYTAEKLVTKDAVAFWGDDRISQLEYYKRLDRFGIDQYKVLFEYAKRKNIVAFSSAFDEENTEMLAELGMPIFKIASCDICNRILLRKVAGYGRPILLSTGASTIEEIDKAIKTILDEGNDQLILLACTLSYPTRNEDANLLRIKTLIDRYPGFIVGVSDHTEPDPCMVIPSVSVALGAKVIEKHYTLDRTMKGSGHFFAMNPEDLKKMVNNIRTAELVLGDGILGIAPSEQKAWESARRSIVAAIPIMEGQTITQEMLALKRPGTGLQGSMIETIIGKRATRRIEPDEQILWSMVEQTDSR